METDETVNTAATAVENQTSASAASAAATTVDLSTLTTDQLLAMEEAELAEAKAAFEALKKEAADVGKVFAVYARSKFKAWIKDKVTAAAAYLWNHKNTIAMWGAFFACLAAHKMGWL